jgi:hypothetical protein
MDTVSRISSPNKAYTFASNGAGMLKNRVSNKSGAASDASVELCGMFDHSDSFQFEKWGHLPIVISSEVHLGGIEHTRQNDIPGFPTPSQLLDETRCSFQY